MLDYDLILVLDHGKLVEKGTHDQLLSQQGLYYELWQQQKVVSYLEEEDLQA